MMVTIILGRTLFRRKKNLANMCKSGHVTLNLEIHLLYQKNHSLIKYPSLRKFLLHSRLIPIFFNDPVVGYLRLTKGLLF